MYFIIAEKGMFDDMTSAIFQKRWSDPALSGDLRASNPPIPAHDGERHCLQYQVRLLSKRFPRCAAEISQDVFRQVMVPWH